MLQNISNAATPMSTAMLIARIGGCVENSPMPKAKRNFTQADRAAAENLREIWQLKAPTLGLTQEKAALDLSMTQGAVSQYLKGRVPLRIVAAIRFAKILKVKPTEIRADLAELTSELDPEAIEYAQQFQKLTPEQKAKFEAILLLSTKAEPDASAPHSAQAETAGQKRSSVHTRKQHETIRSGNSGGNGNKRAGRSIG